MSAEVTQIISTLQTVEVVEEQSFYIPMTGPANVIAESPPFACS